MKQQFIAMLQKIHCGEKFLEIMGPSKNAEREYAEGWYSIWDEQKIKHAFSFGHGTISNLDEHAKRNRQYCTIINLETGEVL